MTLALLPRHGHFQWQKKGIIMIKKTASTMAIAMCLISGCATIGHEISQDDVKTLKVGKSTVSDTIAKLGQPTSQTSNSNGEQILNYTFAYAQARPESFIPFIGPLVGGTDSRHSTTVFVFDNNGLLKKYATTSGGTGIATGLAAGGYESPKIGRAHV